MERQREIKILSIVALVVAIVGMSLGFAAFSATLNISSSASVSPSRDDYRVGFYSSYSKAVEGVLTTVYPTSIANSSGSSINFTNGSNSLSGITVYFTGPDQGLEYNFEIGNSGEYAAYLKKIIFNNVSGYDSPKVCIPGEGATPELVAKACEGVNITLFIGGQSYNLSNTGINYYIKKDSSLPFIISVMYDNGAQMADGPFTVLFGDISFESVSGLSEMSSVITFVLDGIEYQAESGMTWYEWAYSDYYVPVIQQPAEEGPPLLKSDGVSYIYNNYYDIIFSSDLIVDGGVYN